MNLSGQVDFVLAASQYNVQRDRKGHQADYNGVGANNMKDMNKTLGDMMKTVANGDVFCSLLQFSLL